MKNIPYFRHLISIVLIQLIIIALVFYANRFLPPQIPLYYGQPEGPEQLADYYHIFIVPTTVIISLLLFLIFIKYIKDTFLHKVMLGTLYTVTFLELITLLKIFFLIT